MIFSMAEWHLHQQQSVCLVAMLVRHFSSAATAREHAHTASSTPCITLLPTARLWFPPLTSHGTPRSSNAFGIMLIQPPPAPRCSVQLFLLLALFMALFTLTSSAEVVALGLYDDYLRRHRWLYGAALLALATYTAHRAFSLVGATVLTCALGCVLARALRHCSPPGCAACPAVRYM